MNFIEWCNVNQGFLSFVLSTVTLLLSIIAIFISIIAMRIPYKKRVVVEAGCLCNGSDNKLYVWISNVGNKTFSVKQIDVIYNRVHIGGTGKFKPEKRILNPSEIKEFCVSAFLTNKKIDDFFESGKVVVTDTENKKYISKKILPMV